MKNQWLQALEKDLKQKLPNLEFGPLNMEPIYFSEETDESIINPITTEEDSQVFISQLYNFSSYELLNQQIPQDLLNGVNLLVFEWDDNFQVQKFKKSLEPIYLHMVDFMFVGFPDISEVLLSLEELCVDKEISPAELQLWFSLDICENNKDFNSTIAKQVELHNKYKEIFPKARFFGLNPSQFSQRGIKTCDELLLIAQALNQFFAFSTNSISLSKELFYLSSLHCDFFEDIAKLRALQNIILNIKDAYDINPKEVSLPIFTYFNERFISKTDLLTNSLRVASGCFSAYISNCRAFISPTFDFRSDLNSELGFRLQRNLQHIFLEESFLGRVKDPAAGSYYFETYTKKITDKVWADFLKHPELEEALSKQLIEYSKNQDIEAAKLGSIKRIGINCFENQLKDQIKQRNFADYKKLNKNTRFIDQVLE